MKSANEILVDNLRRLRKERGLTQSKMAEGIDIALRSYQKYEQLEAFPDDKNIDKLAKILDVSVAQLFSDGDRAAAPTDYRAVAELLSMFADAPHDIRQLVLTVVSKNSSHLKTTSKDFRRHATSFLKAIESL